MKNTLSKNKITGLYVPLITPMLFGQYDKESMLNLIKSIENTVDGFVPCLSSGEGDKVNDEEWEEIISHVRSLTNKPVIAGIKRNSIEDIIKLAVKAENLGCDGFIIPVPSTDWNISKDFFTRVIKETKLPFAIYNTELSNISNLENLKELDNYERIIAIKDSSMNRDFFAEMCKARLDSELSMTVLQGMEHHLDVPKGCDGYLVSLLNVEPKLVKEMLENPTAETNKKIIDIFWKYNLGGNWYITLKSLLFERKIINSAEEISLAIKP